MQVRKNQVPGGGIIKYGKIKYDCAGIENASTEKTSTMWKDGKWKYGKMKYDWAGVENATTNSAGKVTDYIKKWQTAVTIFFKLV